MHSAYLCPLNRGSKFCLTKLGVQRNCNATDADAMTSEDANSFSPSCHHNSRQVPVQSGSATTAFVGGGIARGSYDTSTSKKNVGFAASCETISRSRSRSSAAQQQRRSFGCGSSCSLSLRGDSQSRSQSGRRAGASSNVTPPLEQRTVSSYRMLVPLTSNQSNMHMLGANYGNNNTQQESASTGQVAAPKEVNGCEVGGSAKGGNDPAGLLADSGVPYWNVYEFQDFRQLQHGQKQLYDPQIDPYMHRETIILDNYNRLLKSQPRFRMPVPVYHLR